MEKVYNLSPEEKKEIGEAARAWVTSDESMMSAKWMCKNVIDAVEETFEKWKPRKNYEFIKVEKLPRKKIVHPLVY